MSSVEEAITIVATKKAAAKKTLPKKTIAKTAAAKKTAAKKTVAKRAVAKRAVAKRASTKILIAKKATGTKAAAKKPGRTRTSVSISKEGKDPRGGLTQAGRDAYNEKTGSHLKPGVKGKADTPEKKKRKGSFLTRHFTTPRGPVVKEGEPTRQALQAAAWGEPVPKSEADEKKLAAKGRRLLDQYHKERGES